MRVCCAVVVLGLVVVGACFADPEPTKEAEEKVEIFSGVNIEKEASGADALRVRFPPGELRDATRTFQEARGKIKKYAPLLAGLGAKAVALLGLLFGGLALLVTKALAVAKLALLAAAALGLHRVLGAASWAPLGGKDPTASDYPYKVGSWPATSPQWTASAAPASYPYARSSSVVQDTNDLAYKAQIASS